VRLLGAAFESKTAQALRAVQVKHEMLRPHLPALVGLSGGRDSVALVHFLASHGWKKLVVCHLNHGLRGRESGQDAAFVRRLASQHGLPCEMHTAPVATLAKRGKLSIETCARQERDAFFHRMMKKHHAPFVFLAHHAEDQAETVLGNLCRGAGLHGLSGMANSATDREGLAKVRPLLELNDLAFRDDSSNASMEHRRNRLRHEAIPLLREICQRDVVEIMVRGARFAGRDETFLREYALRLAEKERLWEEDNSLLITPEFKAAHPAIQVRILRHWLVKRLKVKGIGSHEIEGVLGLLESDGVAKSNLPGGGSVRRRAKRLFVEPSLPLDAGRSSGT
jgi:tRNA(Ile)-lysidine synthase